MINIKRLIPLEDEEQQRLFEWAEIAKAKHKVLGLLYAIPNGGKRDKREAAKLKRTGVKKGVPDIHLPVPKGKYHGLYIEMKRRQGGKVSEEQREWIKDLTEQGYYCKVCKGWEEAAKTLVAYIKERI